MRTLNSDAFYEACLLAFQGVNFREIGKRMGVSHTTISNWAKRPEWKDLMDEMHTQKRAEVLAEAGKSRFR